MSTFTLTVEVIRWVMLAIFFVTPSIVLIVGFNRAKAPEFRIVMATALLYFGGEIVQFLGIGPAWIRHHLSDTGIAAAFCGIGIILQKFRLGTIELRSYRWYCSASLVLFLAFEGFQFSTGKGDIVDVVAYHIGWSITYLSLWNLERKRTKEYMLRLSQAETAPVVTTPKRRGPRHQASKRKRR